VLYCHTPHEGSYVKCELCPHGCVIAEGSRGQCRVRENQGGRLYTMAYGNPCAVNIDPIEKKPFFHFYPGRSAFSLATAGCSLHCLYCQNWQISQATPEETQNVDLPPQQIVQNCRENRVPIVAYTYSEPMVFYEYMLDSASLARESGLLNVVISSGHVNPAPLRQLCQVVDAIKIDLKGFDEDFYREVCGAELNNILRTIQIIAETGVHLEIVNLVVPTLNDDADQLRALAEWVLANVGPDVPLHFSRFMPQYRLQNLPPTPVETLEQARNAALESGLHFVYLGNVPGHEGNNTYCPHCGALIIGRSGFWVESYHLTDDGRCAYCQTPIPGVWGPAASVEPQPAAPSSGHDT
jgi:pyruvate formate lyase activating enzyme